MTVSKKKWMWIAGFFAVLSYLGFPLLVAGQTPWAETQEPAIAESTDQEQQEPIDRKDLTQMSLESLTGLNVMVTSSAKKAESLRDATSAIYVITQDDIRRSGLQHVADLLRMVPGLLVSRVNASQWAITARGFNSLFNNKMLVLVDGRSVYRTTYGGVNWNELDLLLEDIDRIEVIRGPGGTLWGSNAVNGIINIVTKDSKVNQGFYAASLTGSGLKNMAALSYGGKVGDDFFYHLYAKTEDQGSFIENQDGNDAQDRWNAQRVGFRSDWHGQMDRVTLEGEYQTGNFSTDQGIFNPLTLQTADVVGTGTNETGNLLAHWSHDFSDGSEGELKAYFDYWNGHPDTIGTLDAEFQHRFFLNSWDEVTWGGEFRNVSDQYPGSQGTFYDPTSASLNTYSGFLQDKISFLDKHLDLTVGTKLENNPYTGSEWEPSCRLFFTPDFNNSFWAAVSRSERIPSRAEEGVDDFIQGYPAGPTTLYVAYVGNPNLDEEDIVAYEAGYRTNLVSGLSLDLAGFYDRYYKAITAGFTQFAPGTGPTTPIGGSYVSELQTFNSDGGAIYGAELGFKWDVTPNLRSAFAYSYDAYDSTMNSISNIFVGNPPPHNIFDGRLSWDASSNLQFNTSFYWVDTTTINDPTGVYNGLVPAYDIWDLGLTWKPATNWEISVWGQDLEGSHIEASSFLNNSKAPTGVYGQLTARY